MAAVNARSVLAPLVPQSARRLRRELVLRAASARARVARADLAVFHEFAPPPSGGGNQFLSALAGELERRGVRVERNTISATTRACLFNSYNFDAQRLLHMRRGECRLVHRVDGPITVYRGVDDGTDARIAELNELLADRTVFQSDYSRRRHEELGLRLAEPTVIHNAVDPAVFHDRGRARFDPSAPVRLISASWSANPNKGAETYRWLEERLDWGRFEYTFVGRTPVPFERIRVLPPVGSQALAELLRAHDVFVTDSRHESCPNAVLEALACGLPVLYVDSGAHAELVGEAGWAYGGREEIPGVLERVPAELEERRAVISTPSLADVAERYLAVLGLDGR